MCICLSVGMHVPWVKVRGQGAGVDSLVLPCGTWGLKLSYQAGQQVPLPLSHLAGPAFWF